MPLSQVVLLLQNGQAAQALQWLRKVPPPHDAHHAFLMGACTHALGDIPQAVRHFTDALMREPAHAQAACALGSLYAGLGRRGEAEMLFRRTLKRVDDPQLRFNLAVVLEDSGRSSDALAEYSHILQQYPSHYAARHNRAGLHARDKRFTEAIADYRVLVREHSAEILPWHNLAELELALGHYEEAIRLLTEVAKREPSNAKAILSLAVAYAAHGDMVESRAGFERLKTIDPVLWEDAHERINGKESKDEIDPRIIFLVRANDHLSIAHWKYWDYQHEIFNDLIAKPGSANYLSLAYSSLMFPLTAKSQLGLMQKISEYFYKEAEIFSKDEKKSGHKKNRIAYVAPNWGDHVTGHLFRNLVTSHSSDFEVYIVSLNQLDNSPHINLLRQQENISFLDLSAMNDAEAAEALHALKLDIAVDLAVFNDENRPAVLAMRPAAIQINWQAAPYSSGAPWLDYLISDAVVRPEEGWCSEAEIMMPSCYFTYSHNGETPLIPTRAHLGLPENKFVFAGLNNPTKINPAVFRTWMKILLSASDSVLWLLATDAAEVLNLKREAEWQGVDPARLLFAPRVRPEDHLARLGAVDVFLDTWPCNGHTTVAESLWSGTPVISLKGVTFAGRVGASILSSVGLPELVVDSEAAYIELALRLQRDRGLLADLRARLQENRLSADCFNGKKQLGYLEQAFREMVSRHRQGLPPEGFKITDL